jgi:hypothetical protein
VSDPVLAEPLERRAPARPAPRPASPASPAHASQAHAAPIAAGLRARDPCALASADPDRIRRLQRSVGNAGLATALGARDGRPIERVPTALLQREGDGEGTVDTLKKALPTVEAGVSSTLSTGSNIVGTHASSFSTGHDTAATYVGSATALVGTGIGLMLAAKDAYRAGGVLLDPAQPQVAQEAALGTLGDGTLRLWAARDTITSGVSSIINTARDAKEKALAAAGTPAAAETLAETVLIGKFAAGAGLVTAYRDFAYSVVELATHWHAMDNAQRLQFTGWSNPARAASEARRDKGRAWKLLGVAQVASEAAQKISDESAEAVAIADSNVKAQGAAVERTKSALAKRREEHVSSEMQVVGEETLHNQENRLARAEVEYGECVELHWKSLDRSAAADDALAEAKGMVGHAETKARAVETFSKELKKAGTLDEDSDPQNRYVMLDEIRSFAVSKGYKRLTLDTLKIIAAVIGVAAGMTIVALGWTPVGWGLVAVAGLIDAAILLAGGKDLQWGKKLRLRGRRRAPPSQVYARRLFTYAQVGYDIKFAPSTPSNVRERNSRDAIALLNVLGISWSLVQVKQMKPAEYEARISEIEGVLKG